ncbi:MAG: hypothetical protein Q7S24_02230 [bacterium]|nr:hypothetical protein [bacterium]
MKWYKKQLDKLLAEKTESTKSEKTTATKKTASRSFDGKKIGGGKNFVSPVAARNRNRKKTDCI